MGIKGRTTKKNCVIPACPESLRCCGKDSGQAGMTEMVLFVRFYLNPQNEVS
jgi:hypothetical protein